MNDRSLQEARKYEAENQDLIPPDQRPLFHLSPRTGWMNDPNGFSWYKGYYHLFYQYYPYTDSWGPMHWGHARSKDLVRWEYLPAALAPEDPCDSEGCWSGCAFEVPEGIEGLPAGAHALVYTGRSPVREGDREVLHQAQCLAFGDGTDYVKDPANPVVGAAQLPPGFSALEFRDPFVWWEESERRFYLGASAMDPEGGGQILLYSSPDLRNWTYIGILEGCGGGIGRMWECPGFFRIGDTAFVIASPMGMPAEGEFQNLHGNVVLSGTYDPASHRFERREVHVMDFGHDFYAAQVTQGPDGRVLCVGWMQSWENSHVRQAPFRWFGMQTLPRELTVKDGRLIQNPVREIESLRRNPHVYEGLILSGRLSLKPVRGRTMDLTIQLRGGDYRVFGFVFAIGEGSESVLFYEPESGRLTLDRSRSGYREDRMGNRVLLSEPGRRDLKLRILLDRYSIEVFANDGLQTMTSVIPTPAGADGIAFFAEGTAEVDITSYELAE